MTLVTTSGPAEIVAARVRERDAELKPHFGWTSGVDASMRLVLAAALVRAGEPVTEFVAASARVQALMREAKVRRGGVHGVLAALILRRVTGGEPTLAHVERMRGLHERMKHHHWFLTGAEDPVRGFRRRSTSASEMRFIPSRMTIPSCSRGRV